MEFLTIYNILCQRLITYTQINGANMFRISDSEGLIGIKKQGVLTVVIKIVSIPPQNQDISVGIVRTLKCRFPYLRFFAFCDGVTAMLYDLKSKCCRDFDIDGFTSCLRSYICEKSYYNTALSLQGVGNRNNVETISFHGKDIVLFDDHRTTLDILFEIYKSGQMEGLVPNLITFDYHEDCCDAGTRERLLQKIGVTDLSEATDRQFWNFVEFDVCGNDDTWISAAMTLNLVRDVVIIGQEANNNVDNHANSEESEHRLFSISHLPASIGNRGCLGDNVISEPYYSQIRDTMQFHHDSFDDNLVYPFVLDFDLDCFSTDVLNHKRAWPEDIFYQEYVKNEKVYLFMKQLIYRSSLITISREPGCCGGFGESHKILSLLNKYFFEGCLFDM